MRKIIIIVDYDTEIDRCILIKRQTEAEIVRKEREIVNSIINDIAEEVGELRYIHRDKDEYFGTKKFPRELVLDEFRMYGRSVINGYIIYRIHNTEIEEV